MAGFSLFLGVSCSTRVVVARCADPSGARNSDVRSSLVNHEQDCLLLLPARTGTTVFGCLLNVDRGRGGQEALSLSFLLYRPIISIVDPRSVLLLSDDFPSRYWYVV